MNTRIRAFTIVEILVVIAIMSLLSQVVFGGVEGARAKARDEERYIQVTQILAALKLYHSDHGKFPCHEYSVDSEVNFLEPLVSEGHLSSVPRDPLSPNHMFFYTSFKTELSGECGQIAHIDIDYERAGMPCPYGAWRTETHCHIYYPIPIPCADPYDVADEPVLECEAFADAYIDNEY